MLLGGSTYRHLEDELLTIVICLERVQNGRQLDVIELDCETISCSSSKLQKDHLSLLVKF
jgi:hypothetical protein